MSQLTLAEALALAILKGDTVAAYALADSLLEERAAGGMEKRADAMANDGARHFALSRDVYNWPEFRAFADRLGVVRSLSTQVLTIRLAFDEVVAVTQEYIPEAEV